MRKTITIILTFLYLALHLTVPAFGAENTPLENKATSIADKLAEDTKEVVEVMFFNVPEKHQKSMKLVTAEIKKNKDGLFEVPLKSVQDMFDKKVVFIKHDKLKFSIREISIIKETSDFCFVEKNMMEKDEIVTEGSTFLKAGVTRMLSDHHHGHSHGPGGHTH